MPSDAPVPEKGGYAAWSNPERPPRSRTRKIVSAVLGIAFVAAVCGATFWYVFAETNAFGPKAATGPIMAPAEGTVVRRSLMETGRKSLKTEDALTAGGLFVQGDRAVGILTVGSGKKKRYVVAWANRWGTWEVTYQRGIGAESKRDLESNEYLGLSPELIAKLGL